MDKTIKEMAIELLSTLEVLADDCICIHNEEASLNSGFVEQGLPTVEGALRLCVESARTKNSSKVSKEERVADERLDELIGNADNDLKWVKSKFGSFAINCKVHEMVAIYKELKELRAQAQPTHTGLLQKVLEWYALDGDGISDPLRQEIVDALKARPIPEPLKKCPDCNGQGTRCAIQCDLCQGEGTISKMETVEPSASQPEPVISKMETTEQKSMTQRLNAKKDKRNKRKPSPRRDGRVVYGSTTPEPSAEGDTTDWMAEAAE